MDNPYESPKSTDTDFQAPSPEPSSRRMERHVRIVAVLMIIHGILQLGLSVLIGFAGAAMSMGLAQQQQEVETPVPLVWFSILYLVGAGVILILAVVQVVAGILNYQFRARVFGIVALALNMLSAVTCYCAPTSIGLAVYGMVVYLNGDVVRAFEASRSSRTAHAQNDRFR